MSTVFSTIFIFSKVAYFYFNSFHCHVTSFYMIRSCFAAKKTPVSVKMPAASSRETGVFRPDCFFTSVFYLSLIAFLREILAEQFFHLFRKLLFHLPVTRQKQASLFRQFAFSS